MNQRYELVVFDWEGTLVDPMGHVIHVLTEQSRLLGLSLEDESLVRASITLGLDKAIKKIFPRVTFRYHEQLLLSIQHALNTHHHEPCLFEGAQDFINRLSQRRVNLAIASNKNQHALQQAMQTTGINQSIKVLRCPTQVPPKPCPQMLEEIMAVFNVEPQLTLMIGDSVADIEMAGFARASAIGLDFYHQQTSALLDAGALQVFDNYVELGEFLGLTDSQV